MCVFVWKPQLLCTCGSFFNENHESVCILKYEFMVSY